MIEVCSRSGSAILCLPHCCSDRMSFFLLSVCHLCSKGKSDLTFKVTVTRILFYVIQNDSNITRLMPFASKHMIKHKLSH